MSFGGMNMKLSDFIVSFLEKKGVTDVFGYPGGMITHFMESLSHSKNIKTHLSRHEQAAAFEAVGYVKSSKKPTAVFTSSGPGATNLVTGICDAWFDSTPVLFITGNVNTYESRAGYNVRQKGFQETDIISIVSSITKFSKYIQNEYEIKDILENAWDKMYSERKGPSLIDVPMNITRAEIDTNALSFNIEKQKNSQVIDFGEIEKIINESKRPVILIGNGVHISDCEESVAKLIQKWKIPVVTSLPAVDLQHDYYPYSQGFIGAYGKRAANIIVEKSDLIISIGSRMDNRQIGTDSSFFATKAKLIRFDIDNNELNVKVKSDELSYCADIRFVIDGLDKISIKNDHSHWIYVCEKIQDTLQSFDRTDQVTFLKKIIDSLPNGSYVSTDVGQNQIWVPQALSVQKKVRMIFSSGFGSMGFSLPAAIGAAIANHMPVYSFNGDGGIQMNIQELEVIVRENLPIKIIILNNSSLGMIRQFQELYFNNNDFLTNRGHGYSCPDFEKIGNAYGIPSINANLNDVEMIQEFIKNNHYCLINIDVNNPTYLNPKSIYNKPLSHQIPELPEEIQKYLMEL